jgi:hypothetical protein
VDILKKNETSQIHRAFNHHELIIWFWLEERQFLKRKKFRREIDLVSRSQQKGKSPSGICGQVGTFFLQKTDEDEEREYRAKLSVSV